MIRIQTWLTSCSGSTAVVLNTLYQESQLTAAPAAGGVGRHGPRSSTTAPSCTTHFSATFKIRGSMQKENKIIDFKPGQLWYDPHAHMAYIVLGVHGRGYGYGAKLQVYRWDALSARNVTPPAVRYCWISDCVCVTLSSATFDRSGKTYKHEHNRRLQTRTDVARSEVSHSVHCA